MLTKKYKRYSRSAIITVHMKLIVFLETPAQNTNTPTQCRLDDGGISAKMEFSSFSRTQKFFGKGSGGELPNSPEKYFPPSWHL